MKWAHINIVQVINLVVSSAAEAELGAIFMTAKELVPILQTMIEIGWPHAPTPIQIDNSMLGGLVNGNIIAQKKFHVPAIKLVTVS